MRLLLVLWLMTIAGEAAAFCGFYVSRADGALTNKSSTVVFTRVNETSVITMSSDYRGPAAEFAMIVPTPGILDRRDVKVVKSDIVKHLDGYTAPRLTEYFDYDPCEMEGGLAPVVVEPEVIIGGRPAKPTRRDGARALGVTIEREFAVGIYDILMLSAKQSDGLVTFLTGEGYKLPPGAAEALAGYIEGGMKFFVARVNLSRHAADATQELEPLQLRFRSPDFMLPIQLGKVNGDGPQDLLVLLLTREGRVETANYPVRKIPTDVNVPVFVAKVFPQFYRDMFAKAAGPSGVMLEYAWDMGWCDPCADEPLSYAEFRDLGVVWVTRGNADIPPVFVTRLHVRYDKGSMGQDLMFRETEDRDNFQGRYAMNHPFEGEITCAAGQTYVAETRKRIRDEAAALRALTGWSAATIARNIAATVPARYR